MSLDIDEDILKEETELKQLGKKRTAKEVTKSPPKRKSPSPSPERTPSSSNLPLAGITIVVSGQFDRI